MQPGGQNLQLTDEDLTTIKKCRSMSFWRGSVPFSTGALLAVATGQNMGFFASRPRMRIPSYILAGIAGYLAGKMTYLGTCKQMFLELHDSRIKEYILESKQNPRSPFDRDSPLFVNTPTSENEESVPSKGMSYNERREYYRKNPGDFSLPPPSEDYPIVPPSTRPPTDRPQSFFSDDRPAGSYQFDDVYRPRD